MSKGAEDAQLLEIYKLHAQAADDVSRRRDNANRMYLAASTSVGITMGVAGRFGAEEVPAWIVLSALSVLGVLMQLGWLGVIKSYRQLNSNKFAVLLRLEEKLPFDFYSQEWKEMGEGHDKRRYVEMTIAERTLPKVLGVVFLIAGVMSAVWGMAEMCGRVA